MLTEQQNRRAGAALLVHTKKNQLKITNRLECIGNKKQKIRREECVEFHASMWWMLVTQQILWFLLVLPF